MTKIIRTVGIDPGPAQSAAVLIKDAGPMNSIYGPNAVIRKWLIGQREGLGQDDTLCLAIEWPAPFTVTPGNIIWMAMEIGRLIDCMDRQRLGGSFECWGFRRPTILAHLTGSSRAPKSACNEALRERFGRSKKVGAPMHGITNHKWDALAVAVVAQDALNGDQSLQPLDLTGVFPD